MGGNVAQAKGMIRGISGWRRTCRPASEWIIVDACASMQHEMLIESIFMNLFIEQKVNKSKGFIVDDLGSDLPSEDELKAALFGERVLESARIKFDLVQKDPEGFGVRSWRYAMVVNNKEIEAMFIEPGYQENCPTDPYGASSPETLLGYLSQ